MGNCMAILWQNAASGNKLAMAILSQQTTLAEETVLKFTHLGLSEQAQN